MMDRISGPTPNPTSTPAGVGVAPMGRWWSIGGSLLIGLFVAYLDRSNLSVGLSDMSRELGFAGERFSTVSSWALTIFLIGYAFANILGGIFTRRMDPKTVVIACVTIWSLATLAIGFTHSIAVLLICRLILGITEGIYWPQQSRFAKAWFAPNERTTANSLIQYYGQFLALAIGFMVLTPIYDAFGWRVLFIITGLLGIVIVLPLYLWKLRRASEAPYADEQMSSVRSERLSLAALGGWPFLLLVFAYLSQGALFWGITLWIPLAVRSLGFTGTQQGLASSLPYFLAVILAIPITRISDKTNKRTLIAGLGLLIPGLLIVLLPFVQSGGGKLALITISLGLYASSFSPNIWSILQATVQPHAVGAAAGLINGIGAGFGGTAAGFIVGMLYKSTGSYTPGFTVLGMFVVLGAMSLFIFGRITRIARITSAHP